MSTAFAKVRWVDPELARKLESIHQALIHAGASSAGQRLSMVAKHVDGLTIDAFYRLIDSERVIIELERVQLQRMRVFVMWRNVLVICSLLQTLVSFVLAASAYQEQFALNPSIGTQPFLILWQTGFGGVTPLTFSVTVLADVVLLLIILVLTIWIQVRQSVLVRRSRQLGTQIEEVIEPLAVLVARESGYLNPRPIEWNIQKFLDNLTEQNLQIREANQQMAMAAQMVIRDVSDKNVVLYERQVAPLIDTFQRLTYDFKNIYTNIQKILTNYDAVTSSLRNSVESSTAARQQTIGTIERLIETNNINQRQFAQQMDTIQKNMVRSTEAIESIATQINTSIRSSLESEKSLTDRINALVTIIGSKQQKLSLFAISRALLEEDDKAFVGKTYSVQAGISQNLPESFEVEPFDLFIHNISEPILFDISVHTSENIELAGGWQKYLRYDQQNADPQLVEFPFKVVAPGPCSLVLDFYRERHLLQTIQLQFDSVESRPLLPTTAAED